MERRSPRLRHFDARCRSHHHQSTSPPARFHIYFCGCGDRHLAASHSRKPEAFLSAERYRRGGFFSIFPTTPARRLHGTLPAHTLLDLPPPSLLTFLNPSP